MFNDKLVDLPVAKAPELVIDMCGQAYMVP